MTFDIATGDDTPGTRAANATWDGPWSSTRSFRATQSAPASSPADPGSQHVWLVACSAATNSGGLVFFPLLFLTPNFVPRNLLTRPMEIAATINPVTYVMEGLRSLILQDLRWETIGLGYLVVAIAGAIMLALSTRVIRNYD